MEKTVRNLVILFAVVGIALFGYHFLNKWHTETLSKAVESEKTACLQRITQLEADIAKMSAELESQRPAMSSNLTDIFGSAKPTEGFQDDAVDCAKVTSQVASFFQYLDSKAYLIWPGVNMRAEELFEEITAKMAKNPPINVGEMEDLYSLVRNVTHFYRVFGKDRITLLKTILDSEPEVVEPALSVLFTWLISCNDPSSASRAPKLESMYQYACFFLNTLGGRSYLMRRDSKTRMLVNYYSLVILDMANDAQLNSLGLDIRPYLDFTFYDLNNQKGLMYRQRYLTRLAALKDKYQ